MKRNNEKIRWNFKFAMHGYGTNCKQALKSALEMSLRDIEDMSADDFKAIENNELISIETDDIEEDF